MKNVLTHDPSNEQCYGQTLQHSPLATLSLIGPCLIHVLNYYHFWLPVLYLLINIYLIFFIFFLLLIYLFRLSSSNPQPFEGSFQLKNNVIIDLCTANRARNKASIVKRVVQVHL